MQILPNGLIRITNFNTKETKDVKPEELDSYSPGLYAQYKSLSQPAPVTQTPVVNPEEVVRKQPLTERIGTGVINLGKSLISPFVNTGKSIGGAAVETGRAVKTSQNTKEVDRLISASRDISAQLKTETNPIRKQALLERSREISAQLEGAGQKATKTSEATNIFLTPEELAAANKGISDPESLIRKQLGESLKVASWAVPFGKGANFLTKATLPGAIVGGMYQGGEVVQGKAAPSSIIGGAALGAGGATLLHGLTKLPGIFKKAGTAEQRGGQKIREGVRGIKEPASVSGARQETEINATLTRRGFKGTPSQQYAQIEPKMNELENEIQQVIKNNPTVTIGKEAIKKSFMDNLKGALRSKDLTNKQAIEEVNGYLNDLVKASGGKGKFTNIDLATLRIMKKIVNEDYGKVADLINTGGVLNPRQKVMEAAWNSLDDAVKNASPEIKFLLKEESNLYKATHSLSSSRFNPPTLRGFGGFSLPASLTKGGQDVTGRIVSSAGRTTEKIGNILPEITTPTASYIAGQAASRLPLISIPEKAGQEETYQPQNEGGEYDTTGNLPHNTIIPETAQENITGHSVDELGRAYTMALMNGDKTNAATIKSMYDMEVSYQKTQVANKETQTRQQIQNTVEEMKRLYGLGTAESLSLGESSVGPAGLVARGTVAYKRKMDQNFNNRLTAYKQMAAMGVGILNMARGAGTLNAGEFEVMMGNIPSETSTEKQAKDWFDNINQIVSKLPLDTILNQPDTDNLPAIEGQATIEE